MNLTFMVVTNNFFSLTWYRYGVSYYFVLQSEKSESTSGEFTLDIYVKEKNDDACRLKVISHSSLSVIVEEVLRRSLTKPCTEALVSTFLLFNASSLFNLPRVASPLL